MKKKKKSKSGRQVDTVIGVSRYRPEQWDRLLQIATDREVLEDTYEEWKVIAEKSLKKFTMLGYHLHKVDIDVEELLGWCNAHNRPVDGAARSEFAAEKLREQGEQD